MARDLPLVGISYSPQVNANSPFYLRMNAKSAANLNALPTTTITSLGTNITNRTYSFSTRIGRTYELGRIEAGEANLSVNNSDGLLDPMNSASSFYPNVLPYRPIAINCAYPLTGNILNDTNLTPYVGSRASVGYGAYRLSVGANDSNFELNALSNWWTQAGSASVVAGGHSGSYSMSSPTGSRNILEFPSVPGAAITVSVWYQFASTGGAGGTLSVLDGGWTDSKISNSLGSVSLAAATIAWARVSVTVTPQTNKCAIVVDNTTSGRTLQIDDVQAEFGSSATTNVVTGPTVYSLFNGFVERYPQTYQAPNRGQTNLVATDAIASMSQNVLSSVYESQVQQDGAIYYYPFSESSGSVAAYNSSPYQQPPLTAQSVGTPALPVFGNTDSVSGIPGGGTTCVGLTFSLTGYSGTLLTNPNVEDISWTNGTTYSFSFWFKYTGTITSGNEYWLFQGMTGKNLSAAVYSPALQIAVGNAYGGTTGVVAYLKSNDSATTYIINSSGTPLSAPANVWNFVNCSITYSGGNYTMTLGNTIPTGNSGYTSGAVAGPAIALEQINVQGMEASQSCKIAHLAIFRNSITSSTYYNLGALGLYGQSSGTQLANLITNYSGMKYLPDDAQSGKSFMQSAFTSGVALTDYIQTIADSESGVWYVDQSGYVTFKDRQDRLTKFVPKITFGDGAGEIPYQGGDLVINFDPTYVLNDVTISRANGTTVNVQDTTSVSRYFARSYSRTTRSISDSEVTDAAFFILSRYKDPSARPETITLTPARNPSVWATALGMQIGDLVKIVKRPLGAPTITVACFVERVEHSFDAQTGDWITRLTISPAFVYYWNLAAMRATTTGAAVAGSFVFSKGATSSAGLVTGRDLLPGTMLQYTSGGTTYVDVVSGVPTETATTVTVPAVRVGTITAGASTVYSATLAVAGTSPTGMLMDQVGFYNCTNSRLSLSTATTFLIDTELMTGAVSGSNFTVSTRAALGTNQTVAGSGATAVAANYQTYSHLNGATVYAVAGTTGGNVPAGTIVSEFLPNQTTQLPYSVPAYNAYDTVSTLGSWTNTLASATVTNSPAVIKSSAVVVNALIDRDNFPAQDIAVGQILTLNHSGALESIAVANAGVPTSAGLWALTGYKVTDSGQTLAAALSPDGTTVTCSGAVTASAILIGLEFMQVTAGSGTTTLTVTRGTPDAAVYAVLSKAPHYVYDKIYTVVNAGLTGTYAIGDAVIEGYNVASPVIGTARLGF